MQDSDQGLQISVRSGGMVYQILINKPMGFSQSLLIVPVGGNILPEVQLSINSGKYHIVFVYPTDLHGVNTCDR
jgi:hypothetical protein